MVGALGGGPKDSEWDRLINNKMLENSREKRLKRWVRLLGYGAFFCDFYLEANEIGLLSCEDLVDYYHKWGITEKARHLNHLQGSRPAREFRHLQCYDPRLGTARAVPCFDSVAMGGGTLLSSPKPPTWGSEL